MAPYILKRILMLLPVLVGVSLISFSLLHMVPGDPAVMLAGEDANPEFIKAIRQEYGLDQPLYVQYFHFISHVLVGISESPSATGNRSASFSRSVFSSPCSSPSYRF